MRLVTRDGEILLEFQNGEFTFCTDDLKPQVDRWITQGLVEWVGEVGSRKPRTTLVTDPLFEKHLAEYLQAYGTTTLKILWRMTL